MRCFAKWKCDVYTESCGHVFNPGFPTMTCDDLFADGQSQPCAACLAARHAKEFFKNGLVKSCWNPRSFISDSKLYLAVVIGPADQNSTVWRGILKGICQQVGKQSFDQNGVAPEESSFQKCPAFCPNIQAFCLPLSLPETG